MIKKVHFVHKFDALWDIDEWEPTHHSQSFHQSMFSKVLPYLGQSFAWRSSAHRDQSLTAWVFLPAQMGIASAIHLYVFPALPYALMGDRVTGAVSVLGDYVSVECPVDPDEVRDSERPTKLRLPQADAAGAGRSGMTLRDSVRDVVLGGGGYVSPSLLSYDAMVTIMNMNMVLWLWLWCLQIVSDVKFTVTHAVEPMEKGFSRFNEKLHKISQNMKKHDKERRRAKDDACISSPSPARRVIRGIDDPLLNGGGSVSDGGAAGRGRRHRRRSGYVSAESGGESSDQGSGSSYEIRGRRWVTREWLVLLGGAAGSLGFCRFIPLSWLGWWVVIGRHRSQLISPPNKNYFFPGSADHFFLFFSSD